MTEQQSNQSVSIDQVNELINLPKNSLDLGDGRLLNISEWSPTITTKGIKINLTGTVTYKQPESE